MLAFRILYEDDFLIVVDKPTGFHTHPPEDQAVRIAPKWNGLRILERQFQMKLYPVHRLDRASSGVLVLSKKRELNGHLQSQFAERTVHKQYAFLARGEIRGSRTLNDPIATEAGAMQEAFTGVAPVHTFALSIPTKTGEEARAFTIAWAYPETGRFHQIRRHLARAGHPLVNDSRHGDKKLNRAFAEKTGLSRLLLRCMEMRFRHPDSGAEMKVRTRWSRDWHKVFELSGICPLPRERD
ncbi:MAG: RluA family pseudouridine synthase [Bacteriovoracia bacterium]